MSESENSAVGVGKIILSGLWCVLCAGAGVAGANALMDNQEILRSSIPSMPSLPSMPSVPSMAVFSDEVPEDMLGQCIGTGMGQAAVHMDHFTLRDLIGVYNSDLAKMFANVGTPTVKWERAGDDTYNLIVSATDTLTHKSSEDRIRLRLVDNNDGDKQCGPGTLSVERVVSGGVEQGPDIIAGMLMATAMAKAVPQDQSK